MGGEESGEATAGATETTAAGRHRSHTPPSPGAAKRPYLPGTRERQGRPPRRIAPSKGARPLKDRQTERNVPLSNVPAPAALPPPGDVTRREEVPPRTQTQQPLPKTIRTFNCRLGADATFLPKTDSRRGSWEMQAARWETRPKWGGRNDVSCWLS